MAVDPQGWFDAAPQRAGSWWPRWQDWLEKHSSGTIKAQPVAGLLFEDAPLAGSYVHLG